MRRNFRHNSKEPTRGIPDLVYKAPFGVSGRLVSATTNSAHLVVARDGKPQTKNF
jgi:hypothetical protein